MKSIAPAVGILCLLIGCVTGRPDHFYILSVQPPGQGPARTAPTALATLKVRLPSLLDRAQMVLNESTDGVVVLEHERWAAPLTDLVTQTLAQDIERRRSDLLVGGAVNQSAVGLIKITVDIVQASVRRGASASIEIHWRILDMRSGKDIVGGDIFSARLRQDDYAAVAQGLSETLAQIADRLAEQIPRMQ